MSQSTSPQASPGPAGPPGPLGAFAYSGVAAQESSPLPPAVAQALSQLEAAARELEEQPQTLLALLRSLEQLHRSIQDGPFRSSLPADRNALFRLLSEMERSGGWPYIPRLQLRTFLDLLGQGSDADGLLEAGEQPGDAHGPSSLAA